MHGQESPQIWNWVALDSAAVSVYSPLLSPEQIAAARWLSDSMLTNGFGSADVSNALNALPGVLMETRGMGGSRRLNVRGTALRSPFGVRNTQLFVRGFLLTEADGTSPLEWLEPSWIGAMELVSGASATTYGGAYGGALVVHGNQPPKLGRIQSVIGTTGNGGIQERLSTSWSYKGWNLRASQVYNSGYRDWEWNRRIQIEMDRSYGTRRAKHQDWVAFQSGAWALPGGLDSSKASTDSPGESFDAHVNRNRLLWGHHLHIPSVTARQHRSSLDLWSLVRWTNKANPYGTSPFYKGYKDEQGIGGSLRVRQRWDTWTLGNAEMHAEWTLIAIGDRGTFAEWDDPILASLGSENYNLDIRQSRAHFAPALSWAWNNGWRLESAVALSQRVRVAQGIAQDSSYYAPFNVAQILPRIGGSKQWGTDWTVFAQISSGFSDPTNFESLSTDAAGNIIQPLSAERAWTLEVGGRHPIGELVMYRQAVMNPILSDANAQDESSFVNGSSSLLMQGIEATAGHHWGPHHVHGAAAVQFHTWEFGDLPGSPRWTANVLYRWSGLYRMQRFKVGAWMRAVGATPLNASGDAEHPAYALFNASVDWLPPFSPWTFSVGIRNATNTAYSGWHQLSLDNTRRSFYNPASPRTWFLSVVYELGRS